MAQLRLGLSLHGGGHDRSMGGVVKRFDRWGLAVFAALVAFPFLGSFGLLEPDEGRFAQIGREMMASGDYLVPRLNGVEQFYKPPLVYWLNAFAYRFFGVTAGAARLPSALAFFGVIWMTGWMGWRLIGRAGGWCAALVVASMVEPYALGRQITLDMTLTFWTTAALACLVEVGQGTTGRKFGLLLFLCAGLGFLAKGPMAWVVPGIASLGWSWGLRRQGQRLGLPWRTGLWVTLVVSLGWFVAVCLKYPGLWSYFAGYELVDRFASTTHGRSKPWWFFLPILAGGMIPWTGFLPGLVMRTVRKFRSGSFSVSQASLGLAVVVPFLVVSSSGSKLLTYILPIFPPLAVALVWWLNRPGDEGWKKAGWCSGLVLLAVWGPGFFLVSHLWEEAREASPSLVYLFGATALGLGLGAHWWGWLRDRSGLEKTAALGVTGILLWHGACLQMSRINDLLGRQASVRQLAEISRKQDPERIFIYRARAAGFLFVLDRPCWIRPEDADVVVPPSPPARERFFNQPEDLTRGLRSGQKVEGITLRHVFQSDFNQERWQVIGRSGSFLLVRAFGEL